MVSLPAAVAVAVPSVCRIMFCLDRRLRLRCRPASCVGVGPDRGLRQSSATTLALLGASDSGNSRMTTWRVDAGRDSVVGTLRWTSSRSPPTDWRCPGVVSSASFSRRQTHLPYRRRTVGRSEFSPTLTTCSGEPRRLVSATSWSPVSLTSDG